MTIHEAIDQLKSLLDHCKTMRESGEIWARDCEALRIALADIRVPTREQVEKSWAGCEYCEKHKINLVRIEMNYNDSPGSPERLNPTRVPKFCPMCGRPLTDEAVEITLRRLEALHENNR